MVQLEAYLEHDLESFLKQPRDRQVLVLHTQCKSACDSMMLHQRFKCFVFVSRKYQV